MDNERFDELIRTVTTGKTRRGALKVFAASLVGAAGLAGGLEAEARRKNRRKRVGTKSTKINPGVCEELDSGKIDDDSESKSIEVCAKDFEGYEDQCITGYCVKAGSINQKLGPEYDYTLEPNLKCITLTHSSGKNISHYSLEFGPCELPPPGVCPGKGKGTEKVVCCDKPGTSTGNPSICCPVVAKDGTCGYTPSGQACCGAGSGGKACVAPGNPVLSDGTCSGHSAS
jgi:hypothetical protein